MNDGVLVVKFAALEQAGTDINGALRKLEADLEELKGIGERLMSTWDGQAQEAYLRRQTEWRAAAHDLSEILNQIKGALAHSTQEYLSTEKRATSLFE